MSSGSEVTDCTHHPEILAMSEANNHLAIHLHKLLAKEQTNVFFSPFSLSTAMAMLFCGSRGETANEMRPALGYDIANIKDSDVKSCFQNLLKTIGNTDSYTLACANSLLSDKRFSIKEEFQSLLEESFKALLQKVDFACDSEKSVRQINEWVKEKTNGMIPKLLKSLNSNTVMVILNAVYFKGNWLNQFDAKKTCREEFYNNGNEKKAKKVEMMHLKETFPFLQRESFKALQLPYKGGDISMLILLPNSRNGLEELENSLSPSFMSTLLQDMRKRKVEVTLPKFRLEYSKSVKEEFKSMGMQLIFREGAEFGGINDSKLLFTSNIIHKAVIDVNEEGAEASAATAVVVAVRCLKIDPKFVVNHPFLFAIYTQKTNLILFMGRVTELESK